MPTVNAGLNDIAAHADALLGENRFLTKTSLKNRMVKIGRKYKRGSLTAGPGSGLTTSYHARSRAL